MASNSSIESRLKDVTLQDDLLQRFHCRLQIGATIQPFFHVFRVLRRIARAARRQQVRPTRNAAFRDWRDVIPRRRGTLTTIRAFAAERFQYLLRNIERYRRDILFSRPGEFDPLVPEFRIGCIMMIHPSPCALPALPSSNIPSDNPRFASAAPRQTERPHRSPHSDCRPRRHAANSTVEANRSQSVVSRSILPERVSTLPLATLHAPLLAGRNAALVLIKRDADFLGGNL